MGERMLVHFYVVRDANRVWTVFWTDKVILGPPTSKNGPRWWS